MPDPIPRRDVDLLQWSRNLSARISADPQSVFLTPQQAAEYATLHLAYAQAFQLSQNPGTAAPSSFVEKDRARDELKRMARQLTGWIRAQGVTDAQRIALGLRPRRQGRGALIPRPDHDPLLQIISVSGCAISVRLHDRTAPTRKGKPARVNSVVLFRWVGDNPPTDLSAWGAPLHKSVARFTVDFPPELTPGTKVWLTAQWVNARGEPGPGCAPVSTRIGYAGPVLGNLAA